MTNHAIDFYYHRTARFLKFDETYTWYALTHKRTAHGGNGFISGQFPGTVTVDGTPAKRQIELRTRSARKLVETQFSKSDGTYRFDDLDENQEYDLIARDHTRVYKDVIVPAIEPWTYQLSALKGPLPTRINTTDFVITRKLSGGMLPYTLSQVEVPQGVSVVLDGQMLTIKGTNALSGNVTIRITDTANDEVFLTTFIDVAAIAAQYWRVLIEEPDVQGSTYIGLTELEFRNSIDGPTLTDPAQASTKAISSEDFNIWNTKDMAFDGTLNNGWLAPNNGPHWIGWAFDEKVAVTQIAINGSWNHPDGSPKKFKLQYSDDAVSWTTLMTVDDETGWTSAEKRVYTVALEAWRILISDSANAPQTSVAELEFSTSPGGSNAVGYGEGSADSVFNTAEDHQVVNAFDGISGTGTLWCWASANTAMPHWLKYTFEQPYNFYEIRLFPRPGGWGNQTPTAFAVQVEDQGRWVTRWKVTTTAWDLSNGIGRTFARE